MSSAAEGLIVRHRLTVEDYQRMGEAGILHEDARVELIYGEIIAMSPIGSSHAATVKRLSHLFHLAVGNVAIASTQDPVILGEHSEPQPDIALLRPRDDFYKAAHPQSRDVLLVVEVAESSLRYDREIKIPLYARHGIPEVWLVDLENSQLRVFSDPLEGAYRNVVTPASLKSITPGLLPEVSLDLSGLF